MSPYPKPHLDHAAPLRSVRTTEENMFSAKSIAIVRAFAIVTGGLLVLLLSASIALAADGFPASVPKAICGPGDHTESGLQGETTVQERFSGDSERAYNCNLELVGQEPQGEFQGAFSRVGRANRGTSPTLERTR